MLDYLSDNTPLYDPLSSRCPTLEGGRMKRGLYDPTYLGAISPLCSDGFVCGGEGMQGCVVFTRLITSCGATAIPA